MRPQTFYRICLFVSLLFALNVSASEKTIALYGLFETTINSEQPFDNPFDYTDIVFTGEFIAPDQTSFNVSSFYDGLDAQGKDVWKIRFMPDRPGSWNYIIKNAAGKTIRHGEFITTDQTTNPGNHGHVKVDPQHPRYLIHDDGSPHFWIGGKWISAKDYGPKSKAGQKNLDIDPRVNVTHKYKSDQQLLDYLDLLVQYKHNGILLKIAQYPLEKDKLSWDLEWIRRGEWLVQQALNRGIYVQVNLFDTWSRDKNHYFKNNMLGANQLFDVWHDGDDKYKKNYLRYIISRFSAYANVYWELGNEMEHSPNCGNCFIKLANDKYLPWVRQYDPYNLPIGLSEDIWRATNADIGFLHQTDKLPDESMQRPVIMNELVGYKLKQSAFQKAWRKLFGNKLHPGLWHNDAINNEDLRFTYRRTFWKVFTHGGSGSSEATWLDISHEPSSAVLDVMRDHMHLSQLIDQLRPELNTMMPVQNLITTDNSHAQVSTRGNPSAYVSYFDAGYKQDIKEGVLTINGLSSDYDAIWMNPSTGKIISQTRLLHGSTKLAHPEYHQDVVLLLKR